MFPSLEDGDSLAGPRCIQEGDLVIIYETPQSLRSALVTQKGRFDNRFGSFTHKVAAHLHYFRGGTVCSCMGIQINYIR
jgi:hypothetical protein